MPRVTLDDITLNSQAEADRFLQLRDMQERGEISGLEVHPRFTISVSPMTNHSRRYTADFEYVRLADGARIVEVVRPRRGRGRAWPRDSSQRLSLARTRYPDREFIVVSI